MIKGCAKTDGTPFFMSLFQYLSDELLGAA